MDDLRPPVAAPVFSLVALVGGGLSGELTEAENNYTIQHGTFQQESKGDLQVFRTKGAHKDKTNLFLIISHIY